MYFTNPTSVKKNAFGEGSLSGIDMGRDADIPLEVYPLDVCL